MRLYRVDAEVGRPITDFDSQGLTITPIVRDASETSILVMWLAPGGEVGRHPANDAQLFLVIQGEGWVAGPDGARQPIRAGMAAFWEDGESHASGTAEGMAALVIEAPTLDTSRLTPIR